MSTLRIGTYNLLHGMPVLGMNPAGRGADADGPAGASERMAGPPAVRTDLMREAAASLEADVLGLQEVDRHQERSGRADQTAEIAEAAGAPYWRFVPAVHGTPGETRSWAASEADDGLDTDGPTYGVGVVSRLPVLSWQVKRFDAAPFSIPLIVPGDPRPRIVRIPDEPRIALAAVIDGPDGPFTFVTAHLSFVPGYNVRQLRALTRWASALPRPVVLAGDLNLPGWIPERVTRWQPLVKTPTYPSPKPRVQFDHVLGLGVDSSAVRDQGAPALDVSDHCALWVDVDLG